MFRNPLCFYLIRLAPPMPLRKTKPDMLSQQVSYQQAS
jgi:hypothetical protein